MAISENALQNKTQTHEEYGYGRLGSSYFESAICKGFLNQN